MTRTPPHPSRPRPRDQPGQALCAVAEHASGGPRAAKYLRGRGPLELAFSAPVGGKSAALAVERWIKRLPRGRKELLLTGHLAWPGQA